MGIEFRLDQISVGANRITDVRKMKALRILYANVNGIKDQIDCLETIAQANDIHLVAITETKQIPRKMKVYSQELTMESKKTNQERKYKRSLNKLTHKSV